MLVWHITFLTVIALVGLVVAARRIGKLLLPSSPAATRLVVCRRADVSPLDRGILPHRGQGRSEDAIDLHTRQVERAAEIGYLRGRVVALEGLGDANMGAERYAAVERA